jgi:LemA protein
MVGLFVLIGIVVVVVGWIIVAYNGLITLRNMVENAWKQIDVQLKRRYDLIPNLVEVVKDYMGYEQETLQKVIEARNIAMGAKGMKEQADAENVLSGALKTLFAVAEAYPDLKANERVGELQEELTSTENRIAFSRQHYNDSVMRYTVATQRFPQNIIAGMFNFPKKEYFEVTEEAAREPVKVDLR